MKLERLVLKFINENPGTWDYLTVSEALNLTSSHVCKALRKLAAHRRVRAAKAEVRGRKNVSVYSSKY